MSAKSTAWAGDILRLLFNGTPIPHIADNAASAPATTLTVAFHTADPGVGGSQTASELAYTGYARQTRPRTTGGWTVTGDSVSPAADIDFPPMTGGAGGTVTHWSVGDGVSDDIKYRGPVLPNIVVTTGTVPRLAATSSVSEI